MSRIMPLWKVMFHKLLQISTAFAPDQGQGRESRAANRFSRECLYRPRSTFFYKVSDRETVSFSPFDSTTASKNEELGVQKHWFMT